MKTQMEIRTGGKSLFTMREKETWASASAVRKNRPLVSNAAKRWMLCGLLIGVLTASGFAGALRQETVQTTAAPVISRSQLPETNDAATYEEIRQEYEKQRESALSVLDEVIADASADRQTKNQANEQKVQIVRRMENEAAMKAALAHMGYAQAAVVCADERVMVIVPSGAAAQEDTVRIIDAVCSVSGCDAKDVKIILAKK